MPGIWKLAYTRRAVDIETAWLILLGIVICGFSMPLVGGYYNSELFMCVWWNSFYPILLIGTLATIMSTVVIYGWEVFSIYNTEKVSTQHIPDIPLKPLALSSLPVFIFVSTQHIPDIPLKLQQPL